ncbi:MAG: 30S ribosome-binding factor RbfA [Mariprofundaceae bacterium]|nr:30S ribosome-binding factor RbfA [Mariprofundaceae bacterium]
MNKSGEFSKSRLESNISRLLGALLQSEVKDPSLIGFCIVRVKMNDVSLMKVWVHHMSPESKNSIKKLNKMSSHFQFMLRRSLGRQKIPRLFFIWDDAADKGQHVLDILKGLDAPV